MRCMRDNTVPHYTARSADLSQAPILTRPVQGLATGRCFLGIGFSCPWGQAYLLKDTPFEASVWSHVACSDRACVHM